MEAKVKEIMDGLFGGKITFQDAMELLSISEDELHRIIDEYEYEYTPTTEDIIEDNRMILEELAYIESEISVNYKRNTQQNIRPTNATEISVKASEITNTSPISDVVNSMKPKVSIDIPSADVLSYPHKQPYHW